MLRFPPALSGGGTSTAGHKRLSGSGSSSMAAAARGGGAGGGGGERFEWDEDEACFLLDDEERFAFFANCPPELAVHIFKHLPDVRDLIAISLVCRDFYRIVRRYNGLWQAAYLAMPGWTIRPDTRVVLAQRAAEIAVEVEGERLVDGAAGAVDGDEDVRSSGRRSGDISPWGGAQATSQPHAQGSSLWIAHSISSEGGEAQDGQTLAPLPYINLGTPPPSALGRTRGRKSWIAAHLPDLSSISLSGAGHNNANGSLPSASSSRASSHSRTSSWDLASSVRSRVLSGAASMAHTVTEQIQRRRRKSVHVDAPPTGDLLQPEPHKGGVDSEARVRGGGGAPSLLSRTVPTSPSPLRLQLAADEYEDQERRRSRLSFASDTSDGRPTSRRGATSRHGPSTAQRALDEHERVTSVLESRTGVDHFDDLDWRRLCMARWALDRRWGLPIPPRRVERPGHPIRMLSRSSSIGEDFYRPVSTYLKGHEDTIYCIRMDSTFFDGAGRIVSGSRDRTVKVWNRATGKCTHTLTGYSQSVLCLKYDDELLVTGSSDNCIFVWDFTFGKRMLVSFAASADAKGEKGSEEPRIVARLQGHEDNVLNIALNKTYIVSCGKEKVVRVWDRRNGDSLRCFAEHATVVNGIALTGNKAVSVSGDPTFYIWDLDDETAIQRILSEQNEGLACVVAQGNTVATGSRTTVKVWDTRTGECRQTLNRHRIMVRALAYDARRGLLASGGYDFVVLCWHVPPVDAPSPRPSLPPSRLGRDAMTTPRTHYSHSPFGSTDVPTPRQSTFPSSTGPGGDPLFSSTVERGGLPPSAQSVNFSAPDPFAYPDNIDPEPLSEFRDHSNRVVSLAIDGTHLVSASYDRRICVRNFAVALPGDPFTSVDLDIVGGGDALCS